MDPATFRAKPREVRAEMTMFVSSRARMQAWEDKQQARKVRLEQLKQQAAKTAAQGEAEAAQESSEEA